MFKSSHGHLWLCNLNVTLGTNLFAFLAKSAALLWHDWLSGLLLCQGLLGDMDVGLDNRDRGHSHALSLHDASLESIIVDLLVERRIIAALSIDVMSQQVVPVIDTADCRVNISLAIRVERRLAEVSGKGAIWEPSRRIKELRCTLFHIRGCFALSCGHLSLFDSSLACRIVWIVPNCHSLSLSWCRH